MGEKRLSVVHAGTGPTGIEGLRTILHDPTLELVGQYAYSPEKVGRDSGVLAGMEAVGVTAINDWNALLVLKPDCLSYLANGAGREEEVIADIVPFLENGINVVSTSLIPFCHPPSAPAQMRDVIKAACCQGGSTFFNSGIDPDFATMQLPVALMSIAGKVESLRIQEISNYGDYPVEPIMREIFGFGKPLDWPRPMFAGGVPHWWNGVVQAVADEILVELDDIQVEYEVCAHDRDLETTWGPAEAGTTAGVRFQVQGMVKGAPFIVLEHCSVAHMDVAPEWPKQVAEPEHQYRIIVEGAPGFTCELDMHEAPDGLTFTANHAINAIPSVCNAGPGIVGPFDLSRYTTRCIATPS